MVWSKRTRYVICILLQLISELKALTFEVGKRKVSKVVGSVKPQNSPINSKRMKIAMYKCTGQLSNDFVIASYLSATFGIFLGFFFARNAEEATGRSLIKHNEKTLRFKFTSLFL